MKTCISRSGLYFPANSGDCAGAVFQIPDFYKSAADGDLAAYICNRHATWYLQSNNLKGYLYQRLIQIKEEPSHAR